MAKTRLVVDVTHHGATKALDRIRQLLRFSAEGYGVSGLEWTGVLKGAEA